MYNKQLSGEEFFTDFLRKQSITLREVLMQKLEIKHKAKMKRFENRYQYLLNRVYWEYKTKTDLAGKRVCLGREKPNLAELDFLSKYFQLSIASMKEIEVEDDDLSQSPNKHKEYFITFDKIDSLY